MFLCSLLTFAQFSGSGSGTENDPYLILNPIQLNQLRNFLNQDGVYFKLMADIDLTEFLEDENPDQGWQPVGNNSVPFKGNLDGNGKTIKGLWIKRSSSDNVGFFGNISSATIKNLKIESETIIGKENVGLIAGQCQLSAIASCTLSGKVIGETNTGGIVGYSDAATITGLRATIAVSGGNNTGGLIGEAEVGGVNNIKISNCSVSCEYIKGEDCVGGICGILYGWRQVIVDNCSVYTNLFGACYVGGVVGKFGKEGNDCDGHHLTNCLFVGKVKGQSFIGGIIGAFIHDSYYNIGNGNSYESFNHPSVNKSVAIGDIIAENNYAGGIIGYDKGSYYQSHLLSILSISDDYFSGNIYGNNYIGGIVGYKFMGWLKNSYSFASITGNDYVGGICGCLEWKGGFYPARLKSNITINTYVKSNGTRFGRIYGSCQTGCEIGANGTKEENKSYNHTIVINSGVVQDISDDEQNGTGVSATTLKLKATYVAMGWDFTDTWDIQETECYPYFKTQTAPPVITSRVVSGATTVSGKCVDGGTITLDIDGEKQQMVSTGNTFSFTVSPLQAGHEVRVSAKADGKEQSYYTTEVVSFLGKGTEADSYQISTAADLTEVYRKGYYKLMNDIDLTSYINQYCGSEGWESIGRDGSETIHFDGNGHKITGLWCNSTRDNTGLFSCFANGTIKNLTVETAKNKQVKGGKNTGIIIGKMINGTIENCVVSGSVADGTPVGGIVGLMDNGNISKCQANVTINTTGATSYVGGIVGEITGGGIDQCFTQGTLTATGSESYAAGLVGKNSATVTNCYSNATITSSYNAAGIVAYNYGVVDKCYATGNLFSSNYAAGIIGYNDGANAVVKNCAAMNNKIDVTYESQQQQQGGGYGQRIIGGIKNSAPAPELNNYALKSMQVSVNNVAQKVYDDIMNGVGKNGSDLLKASTYQELGWDFTNTWSIKEDENYPSLKNNSGDVVKPGEDPNPDPDPEPTQTDDDKITVAEVGATKGQQAAFGIDLENKTTDLTAYQFDLTLPDGFSLSVNDKGRFLVTKTSRYEDDSQTLNISKLEGNTYRFVCFSMSNEVITGTSGAILNASLTIGESVNEGSYEATISNIVVTKTDGTQLKLSDSKFNIVVTNVIKGDANGDGEVNVSDIVEIVNYIMNKPSDKFVFTAADVNEDGEVNVTDIVKVVSIIMSANSSQAKMGAAQTEMTDNDQVQLVDNEDQTISLTLNNEGGYVASQFDLVLSDNQSLESIMLNNNRTDNHILTYTKTGENRYRVLSYSLNNATYDGHSGELLDIKVAGNGDVSVEDILFVTAEETEKRFSPLHSVTTGISVTTKQAEAMDIYSVDGRLVHKQAKSMDGLERGIYIINGKKHIVR